MVLTKKTVNLIWGLLTATLMSVTGLAMAAATAQPAQVVAADRPVGYGAGTTGGAGGTSVTVCHRGSVPGGAGQQGGQCASDHLCGWHHHPGQHRTG